ncbi:MULTISPECIES: MarR family winged helix-turn-helix transcriptional regulator [unclassified Thermoactinomyces]|uniref:MarR family winged helix-turn-helix transcriptional regulator n=1 Tax=unclassified Thermoactinomyces TaxID=2634588 RepID=UPI0018DD1642|nr:winged helix-turn-helix transcriptional regulator [Thermoactinomyces sp. CICC 10522]MBH8608842.1 winged helix-turn-helix transcriptional regulator [Thermoactinomyces sp. CICC 10521]
MKEEQLSLLAKQISDLFSQIYYHCHSKLYAIPLTHQAVRALQYVALNQASTVQSVAEYLGCASNTASEILRRLSEKGLLIRQRNKEDERVVELRVTEKGCQAYKSIRV